MVGQIWQWFQGLFQGLSDNKQTKTASVRSSSLHQQTREDEQKSSPQLTDTDYEFLFTQLLEGVSHGWHEERILKFFKQLGTRGDQKKWVTWLGRFGQKLLASPTVNHQLAAQMLQLGEITQSLPSIEKIGNASYEIGQQLLTVDANNIIWKDDSSDIAHDIDQEILADDTGNIIWEYDGADVEVASTAASSEQESQTPSNIVWEYDGTDAEVVSTAASSEQESQTLPFNHYSPQTDIAYYLGQEILIEDTDNIIWESDHSNSNLEVPPTALPTEPGQAIFPGSQSSQTNVTDHIDTQILTENTGDIIWEYDGSDVEVYPISAPPEQEQITIPSNQAPETDLGDYFQPNVEVYPISAPSEQEQITIPNNQAPETDLGDYFQPNVEVYPISAPSEQEQITIPNNQAPETDLGDDVWENLLTDDTQVIWETNEPDTEVFSTPSPPEQETASVNQTTEIGEQEEKSEPLQIPLNREQQRKPITLYQLLVTLEQNDNLLSQLAEKFAIETTELEEKIQDIINQLR
ncbi:MAG: hypothetical protein F6K10_09625 [Moorea sp. SIO2B7]|nr:hypothetical protein [Moorena sp. SIO2B7]